MTVIAQAATRGRCLLVNGGRRAGAMGDLPCSLSCSARLGPADSGWKRTSITCAPWPYDLGGGRLPAANISVSRTLTEKSVVKRTRPIHLHRRRCALALDQLLQLTHHDHLSSLTRFLYPVLHPHIPLWHDLPNLDCASLHPVGLVHPRPQLRHCIFGLKIADMCSRLLEQDVKVGRTRREDGTQIGQQRARGYRIGTWEGDAGRCRVSLNFDSGL